MAQDRTAKGPESRQQMIAPNLAMLTGGGDPHYAYGLSMSLIALGATIDLIGSDEFEIPAFQNNDSIRLLNLRGSVDHRASASSKVVRILKYYVRLMFYALTAKPKIFHILWNNKFDWFDRTLLLLYYRMLGKKLVLTAHNVNAGRRDGADTWKNRITLKIQYRLADCIFVHTEKMKQELLDEFGVRDSQVCLIPYGINNAVPNSDLLPAESRKRLGISPDERVLLFFGRINPYKGLEYLLSAFENLRSRSERYRLILAGRPEGEDDYCSKLFAGLQERVRSGEVLLTAEFVPDDQIEVYFKAADALVLPYRHIYQSGVLFLGHSFGLPVLGSDVGSFREEIVEGETGFIFEPENAKDLLRAVNTYFASDLYKHLNARRSKIAEDATRRHSWDVVAKITMSRYDVLVGGFRPNVTAVHASSN